MSSALLRCCFLLLFACLNGPAGADRFPRHWFPRHWGEPPRVETRDVRPLPAGYGQGSSTLERWITKHRQEDFAASPTRPVSSAPLQQPRRADGDGSVEVGGERRQWHKVTLDLAGPFAHELDNAPNPFVDYEMSVTFRHAAGDLVYRVPGYFAADGRAAETSGEAGTVWRAHLAPDRVGTWTYEVQFRQRGKSRAPFDGQRGVFEVVASNKSGRDLRGRGRLEYVGKHYLEFAGDGQPFLKAGADAPETLLAYADFDGTVAKLPEKAPLKSFAPHVRDWNEGDPTWQGNQGKGLIGAINYLSGTGCNAFSFLTYNAGGDGENVWPFVAREDKLHYDCSKLDQWGIVFDHACRRGMFLHFKLQETENDDHRVGKNQATAPASLDGGHLGPQRQLYLRELIARFGYQLALNWNLGEENTQTTHQQQRMIDYLRQLDPYGHPIVVHTFPGEQDMVYRPLLGKQSDLTGVSLQNSHIRDTHRQTVKWVEASTAAGKPWVVSFDESGSAAHGQPPDLGYRGFDGRDLRGKQAYTQHQVRRQTLWGTLMGGGAGVEYYFGYQFVENDLRGEDWRSRDASWEACRIALDFFREHEIPVQQMQPADQRIGNPTHDNSKYCLAQPGRLYLVYLPQGGATTLDLSDAEGTFSVRWYNPRQGGSLTLRGPQAVAGGQQVTIAAADPGGADWLAIVSLQAAAAPVEN